MAHRDLLVEIVVMKVLELQLPEQTASNCRNRLRHPALPIAQQIARDVFFGRGFFPDVEELFSPHLATAIKN